MLSNLCLLVVGLGTAAAGTYVAAVLHQADWYNISFIGLGFLTMLLFTLGCKVRTSMKGTLCYLLLTLSVFVAQLGFTLAVILSTDFETKLGSSNANAVRYSLLGACGVILVCFMVGWWYRNSLNIGKVQFKYSDERVSDILLGNDAVEVRSRHQEHPKYQKLREEYKSPYSGR
jgi:hypothetical protein